MPLTAAQEKFLQNYKDEGAGCNALEYVKRVRRSLSTYYGWRRQKQFLRRLEELEERNTKKLPTANDVGFDEEGLDAWMVAYLKEYRASIDSHRARGAAKVEFSEVYRAMQENDAFSARMAEVEAEHRQRARDALKQKAIQQGTVSAIQKYLEAEDPSYQKKVNHNHSVSGGFTVTAEGRQQARLTWGEQMKGLLGPAEGEYVEAEIVDSP